MDRTELSIILPIAAIPRFDHYRSICISDRERRERTRGEIGERNKSGEQQMSMAVTPSLSSADGMVFDIQWYNMIGDRHMPGTCQAHATSK